MGELSLGGTPRPCGARIVTAAPPWSASLVLYRLAQARFASEARVTSLRQYLALAATAASRGRGRRPPTARHARGVVLACGGAWRIRDGRHVRRRRDRGCPSVARRTTPVDGHRMAAAAGASFANMSEAWWAPMGHRARPGDRGGAGRLLHLRTERQGPGTIIVDCRGRRFVNESQDYNSLIRAAHRADRETGPQSADVRCLRPAVPRPLRFHHLPVDVHTAFYTRLAAGRGSRPPNWPGALA